MSQNEMISKIEQLREWETLLDILDVKLYADVAGKITVSVTQ